MQNIQFIYMKCIHVDLQLLLNNCIYTFAHLLYIQKSEDLKKAKQKNVEAEGKLAQAQHRADAEKREQENELESLRKKLKAPK